MFRAPFFQEHELCESCLHGSIYDLAVLCMLHLVVFGVDIATCMFIFHLHTAIKYRYLSVLNIISENFQMYDASQLF